MPGAPDNQHLYHPGNMLQHYRTREVVLVVSVQLNLDIMRRYGELILPKDRVRCCKEVTILHQDGRRETVDAISLGGTYTRTEDWGIPEWAVVPAARNIVDVVAGDGCSLLVPRKAPICPDDVVMCDGRVVGTVVDVAMGERPTAIVNMDGNGTWRMHVGTGRDTPRAPTLWDKISDE